MADFACLCRMFVLCTGILVNYSEFRSFLLFTEEGCFHVPMHLSAPLLRLVNKRLNKFFDRPEKKYVATVFTRCSLVVLNKFDNAAVLNHVGT